MVRRILVILVLLGLMATPLLLRTTQPHGRALPSFIEPDEHGFDPFYSSYCHKAGHTSFTTTNTNLIQGDGLVQMGSNRGCYTPQNEPSLAVSPTNPNDLVAGANDYRLCCDSEGYNDGTGWAYVSHDGGSTWQNILLPGLTNQTAGKGLFGEMDSAGDPAVAFAPDGKTVYYANIVFSRSNQALSGIALSISHDRGNTWLKPRFVYVTNDMTVFNDKEWVTVGADGRVAVTWTRFTGFGIDYIAPIVGRTSSNGGKSWSRVFSVSDLYHQENQGSIPFFGRDGALYVVHESANLSADSVIAISRYSHGKYGVTRDLAPVFDCLPKNQDDRSTLTDEQFRFSSLPAASMDLATGTIAIVWADDEQGCNASQGEVGPSNAQVKLLFVNGTHGSAPKTITSGADKAFPAVSFANGKTAVGFYTRDYADGTVGMDYAYASSADGFAEHRLSDASSNPYMQFKGSFIGDYTALAVGSDGTGHALWVDSRGGDQNILTQSFAP